MPFPSKRKQSLAKNLQSKKSDSKSTQTEGKGESVSKSVQTDENKSLLTKQLVIDFLDKSGIEDKCEFIKVLILSETEQLKLSCDKLTLHPSSTVSDISRLKPTDWLSGVHPLLISLGDAFSEVRQEIIFSC